MPSYIIRNATTADIDSVLALQNLYLFTNLSAEERQQGFVTTPFKVAQLEEVIAERGLFVALDGDRLSAYTFAGSWRFFSQWPIFPYMTSRFPSLTFKQGVITTQNSFQYGPVCLHMDYRGSGLLKLLFEAMRLEMLKRYPLGITFINKANERSYNAHTRKLGWQVVDEFNFNDQSYWGLAFDMQQPVL